MRITVSILFASLLLLGTASGEPLVPDASSSPPQFEVTVLPNAKIDGKAVRTDYRSLNDRGDFIGWTWDGKQAGSFLLSEGRFTHIVDPGGLFCYANAINAKRQIVGQLQRRGAPADSQAFLWESGKLTRLTALGGQTSSASAINGRGRIAGYAANREGQNRPVIWEAGTMRDLGTLGGKRATASSINDRGDVVGESETGSGGQRAFLCRNGSMTDLGTMPGYTDSSAGKINRDGQVAGALSWGRAVDAPSGSHTFLWKNGVMKDLGDAGGGRSHPLSINSRGDVVGMSFTKEHKQCGYLYRDGKMFALTDLLTPADREKWEIYFAMTINERGWILGSAFRKGTRESAAVLLKPVAQGQKR